MIKKWIKIISIVVMVIICKTAEASTFNNNEVDVNKDWTIKFNQKIVLDEVSKKGINVTDSSGNNVNVNLILGKDGKTVIIKAPKEGYHQCESYEIKLDSNIHSEVGKKLKKDIIMHFNTKSNIKYISDSEILNIIEESHILIYKEVQDNNYNDVKRIKLLSGEIEYVNSRKYNNYDDIFRKYRQYFSKKQINNILNTNMFKFIDNKVYVINGDLGYDLDFEQCCIVDRMQDKDKIYAKLVGEDEAGDYVERNYVLVYEDGKWVIDTSDDILYSTAPF